MEDYTGTDIADRVRPYIHKPFFQCDATELPFEDNSFDAAWTIDVIEHVPKPELAMDEMRRVLRPGGVLLFAPAWHTRPWFAEGWPVRRYRDLCWKDRFLKASIVIRDSASIRHPWILVRRLCRGTFYRLAQKPIRLSYRELRPNHTHFWMPDSDAASSLDPYDVMLWFESRGDVCLNCRGFIRKIAFRGKAIEVTVKKDMTNATSDFALAARQSRVASEASSDRQSSLHRDKPGAGLRGLRG